MSEGWPGLTPQFVETVARFGLRVVMILREKAEYDRDVTVGQVLDIERLRDAGTPDYRSILGSAAADTITFAFDTLLKQHLVGGSLEGTILKSATLRPSTLMKLGEVGASGMTRGEVIQQALDAAKAGTPQDPGIFTRLALDLGLKP